MKQKSTNMQKTWNIFNECDSPNSASSTDANYSSPSGGNSSDDSNCSNQTNYSISTGIMASPPASSGSSSSPTSSSSTSSDDSPPPPTTPPPPVKEIKENPPFNYVTTPQLAETTLQRIKQRYCTPPDNNGNNSETVMRSLELLRMTIQNSFDKDIDAIIRRYVETFFMPAFSNIKENLGDTAVSEEVLLKMSCALLENSKTQYHGLRMRGGAQAFYFADTVKLQNEQTQMRAGIKRHATANVSSTTSATATNLGFNNSTPPLKRAFSSISAKTNTSLMTAAQAPQPTCERRVMNSAPLPPSNFQPFCGNAVPNQTGSATARRQIFWNTANVSIATKFVLDVQANQAFGFGTDGRERLASKHPELIRYLPDAEDRNWLIAQHIISQNNRNSRFLFLIYDEVCNLLQTHEVYRNKSNINMAIMRTFLVPEFMIEKMRHFFIDLNIKSRGLITTSTTNANSNTTQSSTTSTISTTNNTSITTTTNTFSSSQSIDNSNNSQLRTALLQGQTSQPQLSLFNEDTLMSNASNDYVTTTTTFINDNSANISNFSSAFQQPAKTSALSSTHATLTALLNNSSTPTNPTLSKAYINAQNSGAKQTKTQVTSSSSNAAVKTNVAAYATTTALNRSSAAHTTSSNNVNRNNTAQSAAIRKQLPTQLTASVSIAKTALAHTTSNAQVNVTATSALTSNTSKSNATSMISISTVRNNMAAHVAADSYNVNNITTTTQSSSSTTMRNNNSAVNASNRINTTQSTTTNGSTVNRNNGAAANVNASVVAPNSKNQTRNPRNITNRK